MEPRGDGGSNFLDDMMTLLTEFLNSADVDCAPFDQELINTLAEKIKMIVGIADDVFKDIIDATTSDGRRRLLFADAPKEVARRSRRRLDAVGDALAAAALTASVTTTLLVNGTNVTVNVTELQQTIDAGLDLTYGCMDADADNYNDAATVDDGSCTVAGCNNTNATNFDVSATQDDGSCTYAAEGCTDETAYNFNETWYDENGCSSAGACSDDGSCTERKCGCMDNSANNYDANYAAANDDGSSGECPVGTFECDYGGVDGCTSVTATNYNVNATNDDGSCTYDSNTVPGCTDPAATNYDADADSDDGSCACCRSTAARRTRPTTTTPTRRTTTARARSSAAAPTRPPRTTPARRRATRRRGTPSTRTRTSASPR